MFIEEFQHSQEDVLEWLSDVKVIKGGFQLSQRLVQDVIEEVFLSVVVEKALVVFNLWINTCEAIEWNSAPFQREMNELGEGSVSIVDRNEQSKEIPPCFVDAAFVLIGNASEVG